jgi:thiol-disulfide isomerase/thioredoxin
MTFAVAGSPPRQILFTLLVCCVLGAAPASAADLQDFTGDPAAPPLVLDDLRDIRHSLEDYRGRVVMVNFWAGWCHPCIQEIPELLKLAQRLADRPFAILAVNVGEEKRKLSSFGFVRKMKEHMVILRDTDSKAFGQWQGIGLPTTFILDPGGRIRYEAYGPVNWDADYIVSMLEKLMEAPAPAADPSRE